MASKPQKTINLALQGGGAHGAFTWGVLDILLEDARIDFDGVSATSAGAMNAAALAYGKSTGGRDKARETLEGFWREISNAGAFYRPLQQNPITKSVTDFWSLDEHPAFAAFQNMMNMASPYQLNPMNINPLKDVLEKVLNFEEIHACQSLELFITATNVRSGTSKVFRNKEITIDTLLASAGLPFMFQAVEIEEQAYWDGGYLGNPSLWPLFYESQCRDILLIHVNPIVRDELPKTGPDIENRLNEITFNAALMKELRSINFVKKLINEDMLKDEYKDRYKDILLHSIRTDDTMEHLSVASKFDTDWGFLTELRDLGRAEGQKWLENHYEDIGSRSSVDIQEDYLN